MERVKLEGIIRKVVEDHNSPDLEMLVQSLANAMESVIVDQAAIACMFQAISDLGDTAAAVRSALERKRSSGSCEQCRKSGI